MEILWSPGNSDPLGAGKKATTLSSSFCVSANGGIPWQNTEFLELFWKHGIAWLFWTYSSEATNIRQNATCHSSLPSPLYQQEACKQNTESSILCWTKDVVNPINHMSLIFWFLLTFPADVFWAQMWNILESWLVAIFPQGCKTTDHGHMFFLMSHMFSGQVLANRVLFFW